MRYVDPAGGKIKILEPLVNVTITVTHPHRKMMGCYLGSHRMVLGEVRIHKYTHTNNKLSALNIKILQI
jgi:hypothetical protein